jgi:protoporphyrin/coproporphyrin ferrochelatase
MASHFMRTNLSGLPVARADLAAKYDAILVVGFGGPEGREDVLPFLENVTMGRNISRERLLEVAEHYDHFDGVSPINAQVRELIEALRIELDAHGISLPIFWGNRNWHPMLGDTLAEMTRLGVRRALAVVLAAYSSYSSCRQYREDIARAQAAAGPSAPHVDKMRVYYNHPDFISANAERVRDALGRFSAARKGDMNVVFTAHSIPAAMARNCNYEQQLTAACGLVADELGFPRNRWALVYQSKSGRPGDPWLEPDILQHLRELNARGTDAVVIHPIGFLSDHMEVLYDLDEEARLLCQELGMEMVRARTIGTHPLFVSLLRELIAERIGFVEEPVRRAVGDDGPCHDVCPETCCLPAPRPSPPSAVQQG